MYTVPASAINGAEVINGALRPFVSTVAAGLSRVVVLPFTTISDAPAPNEIVEPETVITPPGVRMEPAMLYLSLIHI